MNSSIYSGLNSQISYKWGTTPHVANFRTKTSPDKNLTTSNQLLYCWLQPFDLQEQFYVQRWQTLQPTTTRSYKNNENPRIQERCEGVGEEKDSVAPSLETMDKWSLLYFIFNVKYPLEE